MDQTIGAPVHHVLDTVSISVATRISCSWGSSLRIAQATDLPALRWRPIEFVNLVVGAPVHHMLNASVRVSNGIASGQLSPLGVAQLADLPDAARGRPPEFVDLVVGTPIHHMLNTGLRVATGVTSCQLRADCVAQFADLPAAASWRPPKFVNLIVHTPVDEVLHTAVLNVAARISGRRQAPRSSAKCAHLPPPAGCPPNS